MRRLLPLQRVKKQRSTDTGAFHLLRGYPFQAGHKARLLHGVEVPKAQLAVFPSPPREDAAIDRQRRTVVLAAVYLRDSHRPQLLQVREQAVFLFVPMPSGPQSALAAREDLAAGGQGEGVSSTSRDPAASRRERGFSSCERGL